MLKFGDLIYGMVFQNSELFKFYKYMKMKGRIVKTLNFSKFLDE